MWFARSGVQSWTLMTTPNATGRAHGSKGDVPPRLRDTYDDPSGSLNDFARVLDSLPTRARAVVFAASS